MVQQHARGQSGRRRGQHHDAPQPPRPVGERHKGLSEPFVGEPATVTCGKGKRVGRRDGVVIQDPLARSDLPKRVAVIQNRRQEKQQGENQATGDHRGNVEARRLWPIRFK